MRLLPDIKIKLKEIIERKKTADALRDDIERLGLVGFEVPEAKEKTEQLDFVVKDIMTKIGELEDLGIKLRDIEMGLVDFPAKRFGDLVFLCWKYGEQTIEYWHSSGEGFSSRKLLNAQVIQP